MRFLKGRSLVLLYQCLYLILQDLVLLVIKVTGSQDFVEIAEELLSVKIEDVFRDDIHFFILICVSAMCTPLLQHSLPIVDCLPMVFLPLHLA